MNQASREASTSSSGDVAPPSAPVLPAPSRRERIVLAANAGDLDELKTLATEPGGFENSELRRLAWPVLLGLSRDHESVPESSPPSIPPTASEVSSAVEVDGVARETSAGSDDNAEKSEQSGGLEVNQHRDEGQVRLDVNRSFVSYPQGITPEEKETLRVVLERVIITVLRRHPSLRYFQGYHDIVSVLQLTLVDEELVLRATERMSLHRTRDNMGADLKPVLGYLKLVHRILAHADPELAETINIAADLPYFALSWVLTQLSHDLTTINDLSRLFDFLLSQNPAMILYLGVAIILLKREELAKLDEDSAADPAMIHHTLASLPSIVDTFVGHIVLEATKTEDGSGSIGNRSPSPSPSTSTATDFLSESLISLSELSSQSSPSSTFGLDDSMLCDPDIFSLAHFPPPLSSPPPAAPSSNGSSSSSSSSSTKNQITISIDDLIQTSLHLYETHPLLGENGIDADTVMGSKSCIFTWPLSVEGKLSDQDADDIAEKGIDIVLPLVDSSPPTKEEGERAEKEKEERRRGRGRGRRREIRLGVGIFVVGLVGVVLAVYGEEIKNALKAWGGRWTLG